MFTDSAVVKLLIEHGADVNFRDNGMSALCVAMEKFTSENN